MGGLKNLIYGTFQKVGRFSCISQLGRVSCISKISDCDPRISVTVDDK